MQQVKKPRKSEVTSVGNHFDFKYTGHNELKGKSISLGFYKPINPLVDKFELARTKML